MALVPSDARGAAKEHWYNRLWHAYQRQKLRVDGILVGAVGMGLLVWAGVLSATTTHPPPTPELAVLLLGAAAFQVAGGVTFGKVGHVDREKAKSALRRLVRVGNTVRDLRILIIEALEADTQRRLHDIAIRTDQGLDAVRGGVIDALADWSDIRPDALAQELPGLRNLVTERGNHDH